MAILSLLRHGRNGNHLAGRIGRIHKDHQVGASGIVSSRQHTFDLAMRKHARDRSVDPRGFDECSSHAIHSKKAGRVKTTLPAGYLDMCKRTGHKPITADYAVWLVTVKKLRPAVVPANFTRRHLNQLPLDEQKRWVRVARRRYLKKLKTKLPEGS